MPRVNLRQPAACDEDAIGVDHGQLMPRRKGDDQFAVINDAPLTTTIRPPFGEPANAETARSISPASDSPIGFNSTSNEFATAVYHDVGTAEHYTTWPGYCLKALRVNSRTPLAFAPGDAR